MPTQTANYDNNNHDNDVNPFITYRSSRKFFYSVRLNSLRKLSNVFLLLLILASNSSSLGLSKSVLFNLEYSSEVIGGNSLIIVT
ncbi:hypothetical protein BLOT_010857 [Blomia tropicalis]|nr:hypothetical protein BLOT_010857 [Blomia tropicalis]